MIKQAIDRGLSFGLTSGVITTLGLIVGLEALTESKLPIIGGILTIAIADSFSDAMGIHISEETENHSLSSVWLSTLSTLITKFIVSSSFILPILLFPLNTGLWVCIAWGIFLLGATSFMIAKKNKEEPLGQIVEHLLIGIIVVVLTHFISRFISRNFN